jgi:transcriptional regulator with XRE-family HTH domain
MINAAQVRAARGLLDLSQAELSRLAEVSIGTIKKFESSAGEPRVTVQILLRIQRALENAGVVFIEEDERGGPGLRLNRRATRM